MRERATFYTKHLHGRWRCASSPSNRSFLAVPHNDKSRCLQFHITERCHFTTVTPFCIQHNSADHTTCCCQSSFPSFGCLNSNFFGELWCSKAAYISQSTTLQSEFSFLSGAAVAFSTGHLPGSHVYFLSFFRNKYNWPEEIDVVGDIVAGQW